MPPKGRKKAGAAAVGYQHTAPVSNGTVITDLKKKQWIVRQPVGQGGFGVLYLATPAEQPTADPQYVLKLEPHSNGPLFCEMQYYVRCAKPELIKAWLVMKKKAHVGIPRYIAHGAHQHNGDNRFLVMDRFGSDLQNLFVKAGKRFHKATVYKVAVKMLDALEYIHSREYTHADIKAANILLGHNDQEEVYLVDYGLAGRYAVDGKHQAYKPDPRACHNGTIEFTSRDAHDGVQASRRSDMEILAYCLVQWLCGLLPWEDKLSNKEYVKAQKNKYMDDIPAFMSKCYNNDVPKEIQKFLEIVVALEYDQAPNYDKMRSLFSDWLRKNGHKNTPLDFSGSFAGRPSSSKKRDSLDEFSSPRPASKRQKKPATSSRKPKPDDTKTKVKAEDTTPKSKRKTTVKLEPSLPESLSPEIPSPPFPRSFKRDMFEDSLISLDLSPSPRRSSLKIKKETVYMKTVKEEARNDGCNGRIPAVCSSSDVDTGPSEGEQQIFSPRAKKIKEERREGVRRSPRKHVQRITQDQYSPPSERIANGSRKPCKNPVDAAIQTSPWLKKTIKRTKKNELK